jgi:hypothetical protein
MRPISSRPFAAAVVANAFSAKSNFIPIGMSNVTHQFLKCTSQSIKVGRKGMHNISANEFRTSSRSFCHNANDLFYECL